MWCIFGVDLTVFRHSGRFDLCFFVLLFCFWSLFAAATAILYAHDDPSVAGMVLDSPFSDLPTLCEEVAQMAQVSCH